MAKGSGDEKGARGGAREGRLAPLALVALGVVFGDIGTSPLYAVRECFHGPHAIELTRPHVMGVLSSIVWSLVLVISVKYLLVVLRAHNHGEGGILALTALVARRGGEERPRGRWLALAVGTGLFGAALLYGDGMITPAISVLSAIEGLEVITPVLEPVILPVTAAILLALFVLQSRGTDKVGKLFGPITLCWFVALGALGAMWILRAPEVLGALSPVHAVEFFATSGSTAFLVLGTVFLVVTGGEALYADLGHLGALPIRAAWFGLVLPGLLLNYLGQGALLLSRPELADHSFYNMAPGWALVPLVVLATLATIIASQAIITGAFSLTWQAVQMGYLPPVQVRHTSEEERGQIYVPAMNWLLLVATLGLVFGFRSSSGLAGAYGVAVSATMVITTLLLAVVMRRRWEWSLPVVILVSGLFLAIDLAFFGAMLFKIPAGGWFPLLVGAAGLLVMTTWRRGQRILCERLEERAVGRDDVAAELGGDGPRRVPGTAVHLTQSGGDLPPASLRLLRHTHALHERVLVATVVTLDTPRVPRDDRVHVERLEPWLFRVRLRCGYMQTPNVPRLLELCREHDDLHDLDPDQVSYVLARETLLVTRGPGMSLWRERLFEILARNADQQALHFRLPPDQVIEIGAHIEM